MNALPCRWVRSLVCVALAALTGHAVASTSSLTISNLSYVNWTSAALGKSGTATGLLISNLVQSIEVNYRGDVAPATQVDDAGGNNYWLPSTPFLSSTISNLPPTHDIIALSEAATVNTLTFSSPVVDPILLIVSLGQAGVGVVYDFDAPFDLLSQGAGYWGSGSLFPSEPDVLVGVEGHGAIQFRGVFSSLSWRVDGAENWHGFTLGIPVDPTAQASVPDMMFGMGVLLGITAWGCRWMKR